MYPIYAKCVELGVPIFACAGVPGPRFPMWPQEVRLIDQVMYDFPELVFVTRHGCEPWEDLAVKLMLKWPNLYYSTSRVRAEALPRSHHPLCEHPRRGPDHLCRLLPDGPVARADHDRHEVGAVQGRSLAEVPARQRPQGPEAGRLSHEQLCKLHPRSSSSLLMGRDSF